MVVRANGQISQSEITAEFGGGAMSVHRNQIWYAPGAAPVAVEVLKGTPGSSTFTMPNHTGSVIIELWGAGGGGDGTFSGGSPGGNTTISAYSLNAGGGEGGYSGAQGGIASGGDININGGPTLNDGDGGNSPNGGAGGGANGGNGVFPGGGGADGDFLGPAGGGGAGAYVKKTLTIANGTAISYTIGAGGAPGPGGGRGADGAIKFVFNEIRETYATSQTFGPGTQNFFVPLYSGDMTWEVVGGGGGGGGTDGQDGFNGSGE